MLLIRTLLVVLMHLVISTRPSLEENVTLAQSVSESRNATKQQANGTAAVETSTETATAASAVHYRRVRRKSRIPVIALDFDTIHKPCDMDMRGIRRYIPAFPNQCIWIYNSRYTTEGYYRIYKLYQLEAFFFGQYYERLKRYEMEPHNYDEP